MKIYVVCDYDNTPIAVTRDYTDALELVCIQRKYNYLYPYSVKEFDTKDFPKKLERSRNFLNKIRWSK